VTGTPFSSWTRRGLRPVVDEELHSFRRCALCGSETADLYLTTILWTHARGAFCIDSAACCRRQAIAGRPL
jgi:hypothetical protein